MKTICAMLFCTLSLFATQAQQDELKDSLCELIAMQTETANEDENLRALQWVEKELEGLDLSFQYHTFNGHPSLVITTQKTMKPDIFLVAHIDVVPAATPHFTARQEANRLYGRGSYDMKMAIACYIRLFKELHAVLGTLNIGIMLTSDEEIGGHNGTKKLLEIGYRSAVAFLPDGGFNWNFEEAAKGVLQIKLRASGRSAHSSRPWLGENAIEILVSAINELKAEIAKEMVEDRTFTPTLNVGVISGGKQTNQVPSHAEASLDIRYPPSMDGCELAARLQRILQHDPRVSLEVIATGSSHHVDVKQAPFTLFKELAYEEYGITVGTMSAHGSSDARFFGEYGIPVLVIAPTGGEIHSDEEWIDLEDLERFYNVLKKWVLRVQEQAPE